MHARRLPLLGLRLAALTAPLGLNAFTPEEFFFQPAPELLHPVGLEVLFNPRQPVEPRILQAIDEAKAEVLVNHYLLTNPRVMDALERALARHCLVAVVLDAEPQVQDYATFAELGRRRIPFGKIRHGNRGWNNAKYILIDRETVLTGTPDLTNSAASNDEVLLVMKEPSVVISFFNHFVTTAFPAIKNREGMADRVPPTRLP